MDLIQKLHQRNGNAGFLHNRIVVGVRLSDAGMIEQLVSAACAAYHGKIILQDAICEFNYSVPMPIYADYPVILKQSLKARNHLISLSDRILIRRYLILIGELKYIVAVDATLVYDIRSKIEIFLFTGQRIKAHYRFEK